MGRWGATVIWTLDYIYIYIYIDIKHKKMPTNGTRRLFTHSSSTSSFFTKERIL